VRQRSKSYDSDYRLFPHIEGSWSSLYYSRLPTIRRRRISRPLRLFPSSFVRSLHHNMLTTYWIVIRIIALMARLLRTRMCYVHSFWRWLVYVACLRVHQHGDFLSRADAVCGLMHSHPLSRRPCPDSILVSIKDKVHSRRYQHGAFHRRWNMATIYRPHLQFAFKSRECTFLLKLRRHSGAASLPRHVPASRSRKCRSQGMQ
jgi:hypothetical protein